MEISCFNFVVQPIFGISSASSCMYVENDAGFEDKPMKQWNEISKIICSKNFYIFNKNKTIEHIKNKFYTNKLFKLMQNNINTKTVLVTYITFQKLINIITNIF